MGRKTQYDQIVVEYYLDNPNGVTEWLTIEQIVNDIIIDTKNKKNHLCIINENNVWKWNFGISCGSPDFFHVFGNRAYGFLCCILLNPVVFISVNPAVFYARKPIPGAIALTITVEIFFFSYNIMRPVKRFCFSFRTANTPINR